MPVLFMRNGTGRSLFSTRELLDYFSSRKVDWTAVSTKGRRMNMRDSRHPNRENYDVGARIFAMAANMPENALDSKCNSYAKSVTS